MPITRRELIRESIKAARTIGVLAAADYPNSPLYKLLVPVSRALAQTDIVTDPDLLANAPIFTYQVSPDGQLIQTPIVQFEKRDEHIVGISETGDILVEYFKKYEPDSWYARTESVDSYVPFTINLSTQMGSLSPLIDASREILQASKGRVFFDPTDYRPNNTAFVSLRNLEESQPLNVEAIGATLEEYENWLTNVIHRHHGINPHPIYNILFQEGIFPELDPSTGEEQIFAVNVYLGSLARAADLGGNLPDYYVEVARDLLIGNSVNVKLPNHSVWDITKGSVFIIKRRHSYWDISEMASQNIYEFPQSPSVHARNGRLEIESLIFHNSSGHNSWHLMVALSQIAAYYGAETIPDGGSVDASEVVALLFHKDANGNWLWPLRTFYTNQDPLSPSSILYTQYYPPY